MQNEEEVSRLIRDSFIELFSSSALSAPRQIWEIHTWPRYIDLEEVAPLTLDVSIQEVKESLWSMKPFKSPGPDGLHAGFFQSYWNTVGASLFEEVRSIFQNGVIPPHLNETLIALVPKCLGADCLASFRPISLSNMTYKVVTKVIVKRLRPSLPSLISPLQTTFVPGKMGMDNMIIAQELIHTMSLKKGKMGYMAIKIDLEKAFDRQWGKT